MSVKNFILSIFILKNVVFKQNEQFQYIKAHAKLEIILNAILEYLYKIILL
jgi:hypothetical protein